MRDYIIRRFLILIPTLLGITILTFTLTRFVPGGPLDQAKAEAQAASLEGNTKNLGSQGALSPDQMKQLERYYGFDKPVLVAYLMWLGVTPREVDLQSIAFNPDTEKAEVKITLTPDAEAEATYEIVRTGPDAIELRDKEGGNVLGWHTRYEPSDVLDDRAEALVFRKKRSGVLQGDLGRSYIHNQPVWQVISRRFHISIPFGVITILLTYLVCIPLGVIKAMRHRELADNLSSVLIFIGYAIPGYVLGTILLFFLAFKFNLLPSSGFESEGFAEMSLAQQAVDRFRHMFMPLCCYLIGSFAVMTMLMKNQLMDNLAADYVRTAIAKGVSFKQAVMRHAFRNSLVPIATGFGQIVTLVLLGSFLIEKIFDINGFGLLGLTSIISRDYPVVMGILLISSFLMLLGNIISDICVAFVDPRIRFGN